MVKMKSIINQLFYNLSQKKKNELQTLASHIGHFYVLQQGGISPEHYKKAREVIKVLGISGLNIHKNKIKITLLRPGILIGRKGETIDKLKAYLSKEYKKEMCIHIVEEQALQYLFPYHPHDFDDGFEDYDEF